MTAIWKWLDFPGWWRTVSRPADFKILMWLTAIWALSMLIGAFGILAAHAGEAFDRGFDQGYRAVNPGTILGSPMFHEREPMFRPYGQTPFQAGIAAGVERGREDSGEDDDNQ